MLVNRAYKTELNPNNKQITLFLKSAGTARFAYNWGLQCKKELYQATGKSPSAIDLHRKLNRLKQIEYPWMYEVSKCCPQEALRDLDTAYQRFFKGISGYPRFKSKKKGIGSFRLTGAIKISSDKIQLPRLGIIKLKEKNYLPVNKHILSATVSERADRWFVSVSVREKIDISENVGGVVGLDLGVNNLVTCSDGEAFSNPKALRRSERKLKRLQRSLSKKKKGGNNRNKARQKIAKMYIRIANIRGDNIHKITSQLAKNKSIIVIEDLNNNGMLRNHKLAKSLADASFGEIRRQLEYKSTWYGSKLIIANRWLPSSKMCSYCGNVKEISLSERIYKCPVCGFEADRDLNAALNLKSVAVSSTETLNACGEDVRHDMVIMQTSMNQESNTTFLGG